MADAPYVVVVGGANMDIAGRPHGPLVPRDSNIGSVRLSHGGVGRNIAHNMAFLIRSIAAQKEEKGLPVEEHGSFTSFPDGK